MNRVCIEKKTVSRAGKPVEVCGKYDMRGDNDIDLVPRTSNDLGAYVARPLAGFGAAVLDKELLVPAFVGGVGSAAGFLAARKWGHKLSSYVVQYAPIPGAIAGALLSLPLVKWQGPSAAAVGTITSVVVAAAIFGLERMGAIGNVYTARRLGGYTARQIAGGTGAYTAQQIAGLPTQSATMPADVRSKVRRSSRVYGRSYMG